jgi:hypothetical protein
LRWILYRGSPRGARSQREQLTGQEEWRVFAHCGQAIDRAAPH